MKYVRFLLLVLAVGILAAPVANAQGGGGGGGGQGRGGRGGAIAVWLADITLTADQQTKVDSINAKYRGMRPQMSQDMDSTARTAAMAKMQELNGKAADEVRAILTPDQQKVFDENRKKNPTGRRGGGPGSDR
jgi:Spy/CpxP family protein refolding chaperone